MTCAGAHPKALPHPTPHFPHLKPLEVCFAFSRSVAPFLGLSRALLPLFSTGLAVFPLFSTERPEGRDRETRVKGWLLLLLLSRFSRVRLCATPRDGSPPDSAVPGILQARTLEWVAISFSERVVRGGDFVPPGRGLGTTPTTVSELLLRFGPRRRDDISQRLCSAP